MTGSGQFSSEPPIASWETPAWLPSSPFKLDEGALVDLSVPPDVERSLGRSGWTAFIRVGTPEWVAEEDEVALASFVESHLRGREPLISLFGRSALLLVSFNVSDDGAANQQLAADFAESFCGDDVFGIAALGEMASGIAYTKSTDLDSTGWDD